LTRYALCPSIFRLAYSTLPRSHSQPSSHSHPSPPFDFYIPPIYPLFAASVALIDGMTDPISPEALRQLYAKQIVLLSEIYKSTIPPLGVFPDVMEIQQDQYANPPSGNSGYGSSEQSESGKSPLSMSLGFLKTLTEKKSTRGEPSDKLMHTSAKPTLVDGQPSKRRGPKPDSKPALTRRQELNRQAQRYNPSMTPRSHANGPQNPPRAERTLH
jgi:hypothetical protein